MMKWIHIVLLCLLMGSDALAVNMDMYYYNNGHAEQMVRITMVEDNNERIVYYEPLIYFLTSHQSGSVFYRTRNLNDRKALVSLYISVADKMLEEELKVAFNADTASAILPTNAVSDITFTESNQKYRSINTVKNQTIAFDDIMELSFQVPTSKLYAVLEDIQNNNIRLDYYYIYPANMTSGVAPIKTYSIELV